jgi:hypothetical protein
MKEKHEQARAAKRPRTWYVVTATFPNSGRYYAKITATVAARSKPRDTTKVTAWADIWTNHYGTKAAAERAVRHYTYAADGAANA